MSIYKYLLIKLKAKLYLQNFSIQKITWKTPRTFIEDGAAYLGSKGRWYIWVSKLTLRKVFVEKLEKLGISKKDIYFVHKGEIHNAYK